MKVFNTKYLQQDIQSGLVVFLVALPLCLGIALASGAPLFSGIISGIVAGIVVGILSNSQLSVSGPAAGLTAIVLSAIATLGSFEAFLLAGVIAGGIQLILGYLKAGLISNYLPSNVIEGMLSAIGVIIILSQLPHAVGFDKQNEGDFFAIDTEGKHQLFSTIGEAINSLHIGAIIVVILSLTTIVAFQKVAFLKKLKVIPGALAAVIVGVALNEIFKAAVPSLAIGKEHLVALPVPTSLAEFWSQFTLPDFSQIGNTDVWVVAFTIAAVASIETLLCIEAADSMDPMKRFTNTNTELKAQGVGNIISSMIGGLPMTSVIVRTSANINTGAKTKLSAVTHGIFLLASVTTIPFLLNKIPLASLAAILIMIGLKLASPKIFKEMWRNGKKFQFIPFISTIVAVVFTDLLTGVGIGLLISVFFILQGNVKLAYFFKKEDHHEGETINMELAQEVSFLNKAAIKQTFIHLPENCTLVIDASNTVYIDHDVLELIQDFKDVGSKDKNVTVNLIGFRKEYKIINTHHHVSSVVTKAKEPISPNTVEKGVKVPSNALKVHELSKN